VAELRLALPGKRFLIRLLTAEPFLIVLPRLRERRQLIAAHAHRAVMPQLQLHDRSGR